MTRSLESGENRGVHWKLPGRHMPNSILKDYAVERNHEAEFSDVPTGDNKSISTVPEELDGLCRDEFRSTI